MSQAQQASPRTRSPAGQDSNSSQRHDVKARASDGLSQPSPMNRLLCCFSAKQRTDEEETTDGFVTERRDEIQLGKPALSSRADSPRQAAAKSRQESPPVSRKSSDPVPASESQSQAQSSALAQFVTQAGDEKPAQNAAPPSPQARPRGPLPQQKVPLLPPQEAIFNGKKTLVLDLDETLVHSSFTPVKCDLVLSVYLGNEEHKVYVRKRPGVDEFLNAVAKLYEVAVFTASTALYANSLLDVLDTSGWVQHRLFREACTRYKEGYVKDLSLLGRNLNDIIIIDNMPVCYALQPENAIPIRTWKHDPEDTELLDLLPILMTLAHVDQIPRMLKEILAYEASEDEAGEAGAA